MNLFVYAACVLYLTGIPITQSDGVELYEADTVSVGRTGFTAFASFDEDSSTACENVALGVYFDRDGLTNLLEDFPNVEATNALHSIIDCDTGETTLYLNHQETVVLYDFIDDDFESQNPFNHLYLTYNPNGHNPPGIYDVPHFDFHFYFSSVAERESISTPECDADRCEAGGPFGAEEVTCDVLERCMAESSDPATYFPGGTDSSWVCVACVPAMGVHCLDFAVDTELTGVGTFVDTLMMTRYDGTITGNEAMITLAAFVAVDEDEKCVSFETPLEYEFGDGCYPTSYCYGCAAESEYGEEQCWVYFTDYIYISGDESDSRDSSDSSDSTDNALVESEREDLGFDTDRDHEIEYNYVIALSNASWVNLWIMSLAVICLNLTVLFFWKQTKSN